MLEYKIFSDIKWRNTKKSIRNFSLIPEIKVGGFDILGWNGADCFSFLKSGMALFYPKLSYDKSFKFEFDGNFSTSVLCILFHLHCDTKLLFSTLIYFFLTLLLRLMVFYFILKWLEFHSTFSRKEMNETGSRWRKKNYQSWRKNRENVGDWVLIREGL